MRAINFGPTGGIGCSLKICADDLAVHSDDVVICEFSSVDQLLAIAAKKKIKFQTLIIDCRHPAGMFGSFGSQRQVPEGKTEWHGYDELLSTEWWGKLVWLQNPRRLTLDYCDPDLYSLQSSGLGRRQQLEVLSLRSALLLGPQNFRPSAYPLERTIISWARHQGKKPGEDKFERVRRVLQERLAAFSLATTESLAPSHTTWHIRKCEMPGAQRDAYDSCCSYVRGALSSTLGAANTQDGLGLSTYSAAAAALFRLRQICLGASGIPGKSRGCSSFLAAKYEAYGTAFTPVDVGSFSLAPGQGSQPSAEVAELLLSSSGKFVELLSILRHDCGISFDCDPSLMQRIPNRNGVTPKVASKVAILASLPRTQMLVAALLSALGISHKLMRREAIHVANDSLLFGRHDPSRLTALSWAEAQTSLLSFNMEDAMRDTLRLYGCADVIILSPDALASWHGGIGIDRADVVITVDEDWSGRELGTLKAALARWSVSRTLRKASTKMIRLISKDTIEQKLFNFQENHLSDFWPLDRFGNHLLSLFEVQTLSPIYKVALDKSLSQLPGMQILRMRGEPLDSILVSTTQLAPSLDGSKMTFLPFVDLGQSEVELRKGLELLKTLYRLEIMETSKLLASTYGSDEGVVALPQLQTLGAEIRFLSPRIMPSPTILACSDLAFLSARVVLERQVAAARSCSPPLSQRVSVTRFPDLGIKYSAPPKGGINTIGPIFTDTITPSTPDQVAEGLLSYKPHFEGSSFKAGPGEAGSNSKRINSYSWAFGTGCDNSGFLNGCQGCEPLVFFPPVLPKVQLAPTIDLQKPDASHTPEGKQPTRLKDGLQAGHTERDIVGQKRQDVEAPFADAEHRSKRPRVESISSGPKSDESSPFFRKNPTKATNGEAFLVSTSQEKVGGATAERGTPSVGSPEVDYGLLGGGVLPLPADTALLLANESVQVNGSSYEFLRGVAPCDNEEHEALANGNSNASLALISLFIKKRHRGLPHRPPGGLPSHLRSDNMTALASTRDINVDEPGKKFKKKPGSQVAQSAFTHVSLLGQSRPGIVPSTVAANSGDEPKRRMLATYVSRQYGTGLTMFESASFRIANIQVHNRVKARIDRELSKAFLSGEAGAGLPTFALNRPRLNAELEQGVIHFAQEVQQLEVGSHTGDAARATATAQFSALSRSHSSPSRVDFGPFGSGFLSSTTGMAGLSPTRSRLGVSLPMGVKLAHSSHEQKQPSWSQEDDALLKAAVIRFGMNWIIIARALSGLQGFLIGSDGASIIRRMAPSSRSSRQCRDRWQSLLRTQPSLASEVRKSEQKLREVHLQELNGETVRSYAAVAAAHQENAILLTHASLFVEDTHEPSLPKANESRSESSRTKPFVTLKASMVKRQVIPLTLPGILPGGQPNQPVPSHPSHMQSVQSSVAAQWSNGRTELWPLQILDCADKHRAATIASAQRAATSEIKVAPSSGREVAVSSNRSSASTAVTSAHMSTSGPPRVQRLPAAPMAGVNVHGPGSSAPPAVQKTPNTSIPKTPNTSNNSA
jgi:Myb-like DNA-binding domain